MTYDDPPITQDEYLALVMARIGKEASKALPTPDYYNPANRNFKKGLPMHLQAADELLREWWEWENLYMPNLGAPKIAPYCREAKSGRQYDNLTDITDFQARRHILEAVNKVVDGLDFPYRVAIGIEMRNRNGHKVWRSPYPETYQQAVGLAAPKLGKAGLL